MTITKAQRQWGCRAGLVCLALSGTAPAAVTGLPGAVTGVAGRFSRGPVDLPVEVDAVKFQAVFGSAAAAAWPAEVQARRFFAQGGTSLTVVRTVGSLTGNAASLTGMQALEMVSDLRLLLLPDLAVENPAAASFAAAWVPVREFARRKGVMVIQDAPAGLASVQAAVDWAAVALPADAAECALYYPEMDSLLDGRTVRAGVGGTMAAVYAQATRDTGIWKSPAGAAFPLNGTGLALAVTTAGNETLNTAGISAVRSFAGTGIVPWGARTMDRLDADNRYISVVRTRRWLEASIRRGLSWTATVDSAPVQWAAMRSETESFFQTLYQRGAFQGAKPEEAFFVKCDATTTTQADIDAGRAVLLYGFAPLRPAEFTVDSLTFSLWKSGRPVPQTAPVLRKAGNGFAAAWFTQPGFRYTLQYGPALQFASSLPAQNGEGTWQWADFSSVGSSGFFRLRIEPLR